MRLSDLPTPCLILDRQILQHNITRMAQAVARHGVALRPHMKTAKSIDVARMALAANPAKPGVENDGHEADGITVSTLAEAEYFTGHGLSNMLYAVGITPQKLDQVAKLNAAGAGLMVITDDAMVAEAISAHSLPPRTLIEIDTGEHRGGLSPDDPMLLEIATRLGRNLAGVCTHAGHSYGARSDQDLQQIADAERTGALRAAERLRAAGHAAPIVSIGSSPTALADGNFAGITELRAGVYMFGDLFQAEIGTHGPDDIAVSVLTSVIGHRPAQNRLLVDAGAIALSKDRSTEATGNDQGYGLAIDLAGNRSLGRSIVSRAYQEHGLIDLDPALPTTMPPIGSPLRILPNHSCMTAAAYDRYFVVDTGRDAVVAIWPRVNGW
jgi:D-serine deaminase-like pyridoxal phosphate-dependent protein